MLAAQAQHTAEREVQRASSPHDNTFATKQRYPSLCFANSFLVVATARVFSLSRPSHVVVCWRLTPNIRPNDRCNNTPLAQRMQSYQHRDTPPMLRHKLTCCHDCVEASASSSSHYVVCWPFELNNILTNESTHPSCRNECTHNGAKRYTYTTG
jgi:hypothetical protein